jgi:hypothetical protein
MGLPYFISYLPTVFLSAFYTIISYQLLKQEKDIDKGKILQWAILTVIYVIVMKGSFFIEFSMSPDEQQWIFSARTFAQDPWNWFKEYYPYEISRSLTVIPLGLFACFVSELNFVHARALFLMLFFLNMVILYAVMQRRFSIYEICKAISWFSLLYSMTTFVDFASYNSEMPALIFILLSLLFLFRLLDSVELRFSAYALSISSVCIPFAKEQALYIGLFVWFFGALCLIKNREWKLMFQYVVLSVLMIILFLFPLVYFDTLSVYFENVLIVIQYQSNGFGLVEKDLINITFVIYFLKLVFLNTMWFFPFLLFLTFLILVLKMYGLHFFRADSKGKRDGFFLLFSLVVLFSIYLPRNGIRHYCVFLIPTTIWSLAFIFNRLKGKQWLVILITVLPFLIGADPQFRKEIFPVRGYRTPDTIFARDRVYQAMKSHVKPGSKVMIWGWANHFYNLFHCQRCSHFLYPQFAFGFYASKDFVNQVYVKDLIEFVPDYVVQAVGNDCFYFTDSVMHDMMNRNFKLASILRNNYKLIYRNRGVKIYAHKGS